MDKPRSEEIRGSTTRFIADVEFEGGNDGRGEEFGADTSKETCSAVQPVGQETGKEVDTKAENLGGTVIDYSERVYNFDASVSLADFACYVTGCEQAQVRPSPESSLSLLGRRLRC